MLLIFMILVIAVNEIEAIPLIFSIETISGKLHHLKGSANNLYFLEPLKLIFDFFCCLSQCTCEWRKLATPTFRLINLAHLIFSGFGAF
ncbi:hypothetical protein A8E68_07445 [Burkholderia cenocepacia]|uniref:Uncharacterized protein n=1 Tax=Burkholderia cenocepacia TaxID=95486 RepID=A0A1V2VTY2_9BURK|nr:hypothetical protein A8E67_35510 [Burkholderia cenocepacia]ONU66301.1 hypothetical protein A8E68_07445 [Burkholderia cenocepacia]ONU76349.1 hypothetical protein A8E72_34110 [Burkholderia cenocepacia]ONU79484.1 hypothetical protein A8E73_22055 [Burkholderia cenocepacia]ONV09036.1 hypothetical protein A8E70_20110 [Burkholderia cenocepacia]